MPRPNTGSLRVAAAIAVTSLAVGAAAMSCSYPDFIYVAEDGQGGGTASSTRASTVTSSSQSSSESSSRASSSSSSSSSSTGGPIFQVPCKDGTLCKDGAPCCFNSMKTSCDGCRPADEASCGDNKPNCPALWGTLTCNESTDCQGGKICCLTLQVFSIGLLPVAAACVEPGTCTSSSTTRVQGCDEHKADECPGECTPTDYPGYSYCP